ncbi:hypothetical protein [Actinomyces slackii]|uniref:hypothetical protein n=1 Tax=Actinomyces slackii TaxID=52774 RepID=UPI000F83FCAE|nr:hypothetical protein [Actinomyces slackii]
MVVVDDNAGGWTHCEALLDGNIAASADITLGSTYRPEGYDRVDLSMVSAHEENLDKELVSKVRHRHPMLFVENAPSDSDPYTVSYRFGQCSRENSHHAVPVPLLLESAAQSAILVLSDQPFSFGLLAGIERIDILSEIPEQSVVEFRFRSTRHIGRAVITDVDVFSNSRKCVKVSRMLIAIDSIGG